jgi:hypothetical protein
MCIGIPLVNVIIINFIDPTRMFSYIAFLRIAFLRIAFLRIAFLLAIIFLYFYIQKIEILFSPQM